MKVRCAKWVPVFVLFGLTIQSGSSASFLPNSKPQGPAQARLSQLYGHRQLSFEVNQGQRDPQVKFLSRGSAYTLLLTPTEIVLSSSAASQAVRMRLLGATATPVLRGEDELPTRSNYFIGSDPRKWRTNVANYAKVRYQNVYPGVDLVFYGAQGRLEYDLVVAPGADPNVVRLAFEGAGKMRLDAAGDLLLLTAAGELRQHKPLVYQEVEGVRKTIPGRHILKGRREVGFQLGAFDAGKPLIIDPVLSYSTYLGGKSGDSAAAIAVDSSGAVYVTGSANSSDFPTAGPVQSTNKGQPDLFVAKLSSSGTSLVYSTYLGGTGEDEVHAIAVDASGNAYVTGRTTSTDFPTMNPLQATNRRGSGFSWLAGDVFVTKLNATGSALVYSTFLGGTSGEVAYGIAVDASGSAYITGATQSQDFPTQKPFQANYGGGTEDGFVAKLNASGSALVYSTYLGGADFDEGYGIATDSSGNAFVVGNTQYSKFPTTPGALQNASRGGIGEIFAAKLNAAGSALIYSTLLGGNSNDTAYAMAVDSFGQVCLTGYTGSTDFPTKNPVQPTLRGNLEAFVTKLNATGSALVYSTYLGGTGVRDDIGQGIAVDSLGNTYVTGYTESPDFPTANAVQTTHGGGACGTFLGATRNCADVFVTKLNPTGTAFVYSTFLGGRAADQGFGIAADSSGSAYIAGFADSTNFPTTSGALRSASAGGEDAFIARISDSTATGPKVTTVSAASFGSSVLAPDSIVAGFGQNLATGIESAAAIPLPTKLAGATVEVIDSVGARRSAPLFMASPGQINYLIPPDTAPGIATVTVTKDGTVVSTGPVEIEAAAPGLFAANANGRGVAAALAVRVRDGAQSTEALYRYDGALGRSVAVPIDLGPDTDQVVLVLYGTGIRGRSALEAVSARIGDEPAQVAYAGAQGELVGLDQVNLPLKRSLIGRGEVEVVLVVDGKQANPVTVTFR